MRRTPLRRRSLLRRKATKPPADAHTASGGRLPRASPISGARGRRGDPIPNVVRQAVLRRDGGCVLARFEPDHVCWGPLVLHHRKLRRFKDHSIDNLATLCAGGHDFVHAHPHWSYAVGLMLHSWDFVAPLED